MNYEEPEDTIFNRLVNKLMGQLAKEHSEFENNILYKLNVSLEANNPFTFYFLYLTLSFLTCTITITSFIRINIISFFTFPFTSTLQFTSFNTFLPNCINCEG